MKTFLFSSSVHSCHLFLISSASVWSFSFLSIIMPILALKVPSISPVFLKRSLIFPTLLFSSITLHCSFKKTFLSLLAVLWNSAFSLVYLSLSPLPLTSLLSSVIYKISSDTHFAFLHFFLWDGLDPCLLHDVMGSAHRASGTLSIRSAPWNTFVTSTIGV